MKDKINISKEHLIKRIDDILIDTSTKIEINDLVVIAHIITALDSLEINKDKFELDKISTENQKDTMDKLYSTLSNTKSDGFYSINPEDFKKGDKDA